MVSKFDMALNATPQGVDPALPARHTGPERRAHISQEQAGRLLHELRVHQAELEMQNEELRRTQAELDATRARYFDLYDLAPVGYFTLSDTETILEANLTAARLLGLPAVALVGSPIQSFIFAPDQDIYFLHRQMLAETGLAQTCEVRMHRRAEAPFWAQLMATREQDSAGNAVHRLVVTDIQLRRVAQDRLHVSDIALKSISQGILIITPELLVVSANAAFLAMTGYTEAELVGVDCAIFSGPLTSDVVIQSFQKCMEMGQDFSAEVFNYRKDGSGFWNALTVSPVLDHKRQLTHFISTNTDITERKQLDQSLLEKNLELQAANSVAEKANLAKSEFLSSMSHELRSPLNAIVGFAQLLESGSPPPTPLQQKNIERILAGGWYLLKLINEILDLALVESGKLALSMQPVLLAPLLLECQQLTEAQAEASGIRLTFSESAAPIWIIADPVRLQQVMVNLLSNAIKYNRPQGCVEVAVLPGQDGRLRICVTDTGEGLNAEKLAQLFTSFNRLGREQGVAEGTGIGLVVTKKLTELMGGRIGVRSTVGTGSEFWVEFRSAPAPVAMPSPAADMLRQLPAPGALEQRPCTVLYVEDNPANVELVTRILARRPNVQLHSAADGEQGIAMARLHQPHVILMDIHLPGMSGLDALAILQLDPDTLHIPVVAVSANAMPADIVKGLSAGFYRYLTKPFQIAAFMEVLDSALALALAEPGPQVP